MSDDYLRQLLLTVDEAPVTSDPVARVRRRMRRRTATAIVTAGLAIAGLSAATAAATGFGRSHDQGLVPVSPPAPAHSLPDVAFAVRPYPPFAPARPAPTERFCNSGDLKLAASTAPRDANAIGVQLIVRLTNISTSACQVPVRGAVRLTSQNGTGIGQGGIGSNGTMATVVQPAVPPAGTAVLTGYWAQPCNSTVEPASVTIALTPPSAQPGREASVSGPVAAGPSPTCQPPLKVVYIDGTASLYSLVVLDALDRRLDKPSLSLTAELVDVPATVALGQELQFGVRLHNPTRGPIPLAGRDCPLYASSLNRPGRSTGPDVDGAMNCQAAPAALPAGADITFRFQLPVTTARFQPGAWTLYWTRTDGGAAQLQEPVHVGLGGNVQATVVAVGPSGIAPSDGQGLASGACASPTGVVTFVLGASPVPRCNIAHGQQTVEVVNGLDGPVRVRLGYQLLTLPVGARGRFRGQVASFLAAGHHTVSDSGYRGGGAELIVR